jgi:excisionase family DNA binding protein
MYKVLKSSKAAIRFSLKHSKKYLLENRCQESLIILWFSFGGADKRVSYSTGYTVSYADWDYQKQRVKTNKSRVINSHTVNNYLNRLSITGEDTEYLTRNEVSKVLNVTVQTLNNWRREGVLNPLKIGGRVLYRKEDVYNNSRLVA